MNLKSHSAFVQMISPLSLALWTGHAAIGQEVQVVRPVAELFGAATGTPGKSIFEDFGIHPEIERKFGSLGDARATIDEDGNVAFHAFYGVDGVPNLPPETAPSAMFRTRNGQIEVVTLTDGPAPGTGMNFVGPGMFPDTPNIGGGEVSFLLQVGGSPMGFDLGLWSDRSGSLHQIVTPGDRLAGMPAASMIDFISPSMIGELIVFSGRIVGGPSPDNSPSGLWRNRAGVNEVIVATDLPAPGMAGVFFGESTSTQRGPLQFFNFNESGEIAFIAKLKGSQIDDRHDEAIWVEKSGGLDLRITESDSVPKGLFTNRTIFRNLAAVHQNEQHRIVFTGQVDKQDGTARIPTIWTDRNGSLELVMAGERKFVFGSVPGDPAPGTGTTFLLPRVADLGEHGEVFFSATVDVSNDPFNPQRFGIWIDQGGLIESVAIEGGAVPGMAGLTFTGALSSSRGVGPFELERDGSVLYFGRFLDEFAQRRLGVFRRDASGDLALLIHEGQTVAIGGGTRRLTIDRIDTRLDTGTSLAGEKVAYLTFTDGTEGIYTYQAIESAGCYADCDVSTGFGILDIFDFLCFQDRFVVGDPYACDCDTSTGVGLCDIFDFLCFQDAFVAGCT